MGGFFHTLGALFRRQDAPAQDDGVPDAETERLRALYRERCSRFRLLLSANKSALEIMADLGRNGHIDADLYEVFVREKVYLQYAEQHLEAGQIDEV